MEFRKIRRFRQQLTKLGCLSMGTSVTLVLLGDNSYLYVVPISYIYA